MITPRANSSRYSLADRSWPGRLSIASITSLTTKSISPSLIYGRIEWIYSSKGAKSKHPGVALLFEAQSIISASIRFGVGVDGTQWVIGYRGKKNTMKR
jgi:hypothetical protein